LCGSLNSWRCSLGFFLQAPNFLCAQVLKRSVGHQRPLGHRRPLVAYIV
jgi:hypothetical protein